MHYYFDDNIIFKSTHVSDKQICILLDKNEFTITRNFESEQEYLLFVNQDVYDSIYKHASKSFSKYHHFVNVLKTIEKEIDEYCEKTKWVHRVLRGDKNNLILLCVMRSDMTFEIPTDNVAVYITFKHRDSLFISIHHSAQIIIEDPIKELCSKCTRRSLKIHRMGCLKCQFHDLYNTKEDENGCKKSRHIKSYHVTPIHPKIRLKRSTCLFTLHRKSLN